MDIAYVGLTAPDPAAAAYALTGGAGFAWDGHDPPRLRFGQAQVPMIGVPRCGSEMYLSLYPGCTDLAFAVDDVKGTWNWATLTGAQTIRPPGPVSHGSGIWMTVVTGWGGFSSRYVRTLMSVSPDGAGDREGPRWDAAI